MEQRDRAMNVSQEVRTGVLFMVDLAGSERAAVTQVYIVSLSAYYNHSSTLLCAIYAV